MDDQEIKVYTLKEASEILKTSTRTIHRMIVKRSINAFRLGRSGEWRISHQAIVELIQSNARVRYKAAHKQLERGTP